MNHIEKCPKCGNFTEGKATYSKERQVTQQVSKAATSKILGLIIGAAVGVLFGGIGAIPLAAIGFAIGSLLTPTVSRAVAEELDKTLYENTKLNFSCLRCGETWFKVISTGQGDMIPDAILQREKDGIAASYNKKANKHIKRFAIASIVFIIGLTMCICSDTYSGETFWGFQEYSTSYLYSLVFIQLGVIGMAYELYTFFTNKNKATTYKKMTISEYIAIR